MQANLFPGIDLRACDGILVNSSGGKDSQTALRHVVQRADAAGVPRHNIVVVHADLGRMEWHGVKELAGQQAEHYGLQFMVVKRRTAAGVEESLLDYVRRRGKWPSSTARYCTSDFKRGPCRRVVTAIGKRVRWSRPQHTVRILNVFGFRAEESPARAKRLAFSRNKAASNGSTIVDDWLPIHDWTERQVWDDIRASGVPYHPAYDLGMPRLSCCFCIFAPRSALLIAGRANPELLAEYVALEREIGHDFQHGKPIADIQAAIARGEQPAAVSGDWNM
jgi:3'-phosphoadenosine 5'-phosphosulfate sulfotransferase (PAPS reductase)/FAD synthetase